MTTYDLYTLKRENEELKRRLDVSEARVAELEQEKRDLLRDLMQEKSLAAVENEKIRENLRLLVEYRSMENRATKAEKERDEARAQVGTLKESK